MKRSLILAVRGSTGSRRGRAAIERLVDAVRGATDDFVVHDGLIDLDDPASADVMAAVGGLVAPLTMWDDAPGDLPPQVTMTRALGPDWALAEVGVHRLIEAGARSGDSIVLAADIVTTNRAVKDIGCAARQLSAVWGGRVHLGVLGGPDTSVSDALDIARGYGRRVIIWSYALAEGDVHDALLDAGADVVTAPLLTPGPTDPRLVTLVLDRARSGVRASPVAGS